MTRSGIPPVLLVILLGALPAFAGPHVVFVLAEREYGTSETVPAFFEKELKPAGYTATFITAPPEGEKRHNFSGLAEALAKADLCFLSVRRRAPAKKDMEALQNFVVAGKPLVAIRTSSHAFHLKGKPVPSGHATWENFDPSILGGIYEGHYGEEAATITVAKGAAQHPILKGVGKLPPATKLYRAKPFGTHTTHLLVGTLAGNPPEVVAWTNTAGEKKARVFYTSLGTVSDFADAEFRKFLRNAIAWTLADQGAPNPRGSD